PEDAVALGALDDAAIAQVVEEARPPMRDPDELHDALLSFMALREAEVDPAIAEALVQAGRAGWCALPQGRCLIPVERRAWLERLFGPLQVSPPLPPWEVGVPEEPEPVAQQLIRGRLEVCGPVAVPTLGAWTGLSEDRVLEALARLEADGQVLQGTFRAAPDGSPAQEWCDRRLLQRIHRLTVGRLRREIEPLETRDHQRFLFRWHRIGHGDPMRGPGGVLRAIALLQGIEAPAAAWEEALLPSRVADYRPELLEQQAWSGALVWGRLSLREPRPAAIPVGRGRPVTPPEPVEEAPRAPVRPLLTRAASLTFALREDVDVWLTAARGPRRGEDAGPAWPEGLSVAAREVAEVLERRGACFFADLVSRTRRLPAEVEDALWELVAHGVVTADAVQNLRVLQSPAKRRRQKLLHRGGPGRWSLLEPVEPVSDTEVRERLVKLFLQRWGILVRELVMREPLAPSWRELVPILRRMEARGELRGGRFIAGVAGEQWALPEAVELARAVRREKPNGERVRIAAVDPLNLTGVVGSGPRIAAQPGQWITYLDGVPLPSPDAGAARTDEVVAEPSRPSRRGRS